MRFPFAVTLALREGRSSARRLGVYMGAITLGVAALVAINSFRANVVASVDAQSKTLLGADLRLSSGDPFTDSVRAVIDSVALAGADVSTMTSTLSVALADNGATRLVQLRALSGRYPYYGEYSTDPAELWGTLEDDRRALAEPELLVVLGLSVGDSVRVGELWFRVAGAVTSLPPEVSFRSAIAPRLFIGERWLGDTGLLRFGSLARYQAYLHMPDDGAVDAFLENNRALFRRDRVGVDTASEQAEELSFALDALGRFLGLIGLAALLLGGLGVASAVNVFVKEKRATIALLRCVGATQRTAFIAYLLQAALLGLGGAALGAGIGVALQPLLPMILGDLIPVDIAIGIHWPSVIAGLFVGVGVAALFALLPLLEIRGITPLQALRREVEPEAMRLDIWRVVAYAALFGGILALAIGQAGDLRRGLAFAGALAGTLLVLALFAWSLVRTTRRFFPRRASFVVRQGVASLFRPHNQTAAITIALGFGVFLVATLWLVQRNLLRRFDVSGDGPRPNLVAFDIQTDQTDDVLAAFESQGVQAPELVPIVPARIAAIRGRPVADILADSAARAPWALRREYRNTYRAGMSGTEQLTAGSWWDDAAPAPGGMSRISMEDDLARNLGVSVGDEITWDVQGVHIETRLTSLRRVDWARFETNFFVVFEPGVLENAPQSFVTLAQVPEPAVRSALQRDIVRRHPNISFVDLALVQETIARIVGSVTLAVRFMGIFSIAGGLLVLAGAVAASRFQRLRESALLRTLGATRKQVRQILFTEYAALGTLAGIAGVALGSAAAWGLSRFFFEMEFQLPVAPLLAASLGAAGLAVAVGLAGSRDALSRTPLAVLREVTD